MGEKVCWGSRCFGVAVVKKPDSDVPDGSSTAEMGENIGAGVEDVKDSGITGFGGAEAIGGFKGLVSARFFGGESKMDKSAVAHGLGSGLTSKTSADGRALRASDVAAGWFGGGAKKASFKLSNAFVGGLTADGEETISPQSSSSSLTLSWVVGSSLMECAGVGRGWGAGLLSTGGPGFGKAGAGGSGIGTGSGGSTIGAVDLIGCSETGDSLLQPNEATGGATRLAGR